MIYLCVVDLLLLILIANTKGNSLLGDISFYDLNEFPLLMWNKFSYINIANKGLSKLYIQKN